VLARLLLLRRRNHARRDERQRKKERKMESHSGGSGRSPMTSSYLSIHPSSPALQCTALHCWRVQWPGAHARHRERRLPRGAVPTHTHPTHVCASAPARRTLACLFPGHCAPPRILLYAVRHGRLLGGLGSAPVIIPAPA
jgi:hypothetical protein